MTEMITQLREKHDLHIEADFFFFFCDRIGIHQKDGQMPPIYHILCLNVDRLNILC